MEAYIGLVISVALNLFLLVKVGGRMVQGKENTVTEEEIRQMVDAGGDNGSIDENEKEMINNIFELGNLSAGSIATICRISSSVTVFSLPCTILPPTLTIKKRLRSTEITRPIYASKKYPSKIHTKIIIYLLFSIFANRNSVKIRALFTKYGKTLTIKSGFQYKIRYSFCQNDSLCCVRNWSSRCRICLHVPFS